MKFLEAIKKAEKGFKIRVIGRGDIFCIINGKLTDKHGNPWKEIGGLNDEWEVVFEPMPFIAAFKLLLFNGNLSWMKRQSSKRKHFDSDKICDFTVEDIEANDWIVE